MVFTKTHESLWLICSSSELFRYKTNLYRLREERVIEPKTLANLVSTTLYERRYHPAWRGHTLTTPDSDHTL